VQVNAPSRFIEDIPENLLEEVQKEKAGILDSFRISKYEKRNSKQYQRIKTEIRNENNIQESRNEKLSTINYKDGDMVVHEIFGEGRIVASQGDIITVAFYKVGLKKLSSSVAPIKKI
jgi:hypothetical protein